MTYWQLPRSLRAIFKKSKCLSAVTLLRVALRPIPGKGRTWDERMSWAKHLKIKSIKFLHNLTQDFIGNFWKDFKRIVRPLHLILTSSSPHNLIYRLLLCSRKMKFILITAQVLSSYDKTSWLCQDSTQWQLSEKLKCHLCAVPTPYIRPLLNDNGTTISNGFWG